tara:strand:+ start:1902 stop:2750 length:849 start_codon:yes stop_codon:yes gene_type:complete
MKVAIVIVGEYRTFDYTFPFWNIDVDCDYYFSTWDTSADKRAFIYKDINEINYTQNYPYGLKENSNKTPLYFKVTEEMIREKLPNCKIKLHNSLYSCKGNTDQTMHMKSGIDMVVDSNIKYDYILLIRPDLLLHLKKENINKLIDVENTLFHSDEALIQPTHFDEQTTLSKNKGMVRPSNVLNKTFSINDLWWFGEPDVIVPFIKKLPYFTQPHSQIAYYIWKEKIKLSEDFMPLAVHNIVRPSVIPILNKLIKENKTTLKCSRWEELKHQYFDQRELGESS